MTWLDLPLDLLREAKVNGFEAMNRSAVSFSMVMKKMFTKKKRG